MEDFYREIYAVDGVNDDIKFPDHYPVSRLLGCVEAVRCVRSEELVSWEEIPESKLVVLFEMPGFQGVYKLERKVYDAVVRGLRPIQGPLPVKFPLSDPSDPFSVKPGSLAFHVSDSKAPISAKTPSASATIAGARVTATQFSKRDESSMSNTNHSKHAQRYAETSHRKENT